MERIAAPPLDRQTFALACRAGFLDLIGAVVQGEKPWLTANQVLASAAEAAWAATGLEKLHPDAQHELARAWRRMPAWDRAPEAIASLRKRYVVAPLTLLSWPMAVGSSFSY